MKNGTGLKEFTKKFPDRYLMLELQNYLYLHFHVGFAKEGMNQLYQYIHHFIKHVTTN